MYGTAQRQLESCGQATRTVWHFHPHPQVRAQATGTHASERVTRYEL